MIGHKAVAEQREVVKFEVPPQQFKVHEPFAVGRQQELPGVAPLRDMMRNIYDCDTGKASHQFARVSENVPSVPGFPAHYIVMRYIVDRFVLVFYIAIRYIMPGVRKLRALPAVYCMGWLCCSRPPPVPKGLPETRSVRVKAHVGGATWENFLCFGLLSC